ncbi:unnamed protein product [Polarella glacialis]|uniref:Uncharacterized protein n=1 Tax=Polarella glacialis TaxID=89957 RepID=A0A813D4X7_POLGL|nr:unnamed protein product [Polarella glacialis]
MAASLTPAHSSSAPNLPWSWSVAKLKATARSTQGEDLQQPVASQQKGRPQQQQQTKQQQQQQQPEPHVRQPPQKQPQAWRQQRKQLSAWQDDAWGPETARAGCELDQRAAVAALFQASAAFSASAAERAHWEASESSTSRESRRDEELDAAGRAIRPAATSVHGESAARQGAVRRRRKAGGKSADCSTPDPERDSRGDCLQPSLEKEKEERRDERREKQEEGLGFGSSSAWPSLSSRGSRKVGSLSSSGLETRGAAAAETTALQAGAVEQRKASWGPGSASRTVAAERPTPSSGLPQSASRPSQSILLEPNLKVRSGEVLNLQRVSSLSDAQLQGILQSVEEYAKFRWFAGRSILDFKVNGVKSFRLEPPYDMLNPLLTVMIAMAERSLGQKEELALLQLIVNHFKDGGSEVKPHTHRCRQVCVSLGAGRELDIEGRRLFMRHGDCLPLEGEVHSVPPARSVREPRVSVCLFYGSAEEYARELLSVNATAGKFGDSFWFTHPKDLETEDVEVAEFGYDGRSRVEAGCNLDTHQEEEKKQVSGGSSPEERRSVASPAVPVWGEASLTEKGVAYFPQRLAEALNYEDSSVKDALYLSCGFNEIEKAGGLQSVLKRLRLDGITKVFFILNRALHPLVIDLSKEAPIFDEPSTARGEGAHPVGTRVSLRGTGGKWHRRWNHFYADVVDVDDDSLKVQYIDGGYKRFSRRDFDRLLVRVPDAKPGGYEVGMRVRMHGNGKWGAGQHFHADIVDVGKGTVKVRYIDGSYKRYSTGEFEDLLYHTPVKGKEGAKELPYRKLSPVIAKSFFCILVCNLIALCDKDGWKAGLKKCYTGPSMRVFSCIGCIYAVGDFLEMTSMGAMDGASYQVLLQSKLVITALMMWAIKGPSAKQTMTQWSSLTTLTIGMIIFMVAESGGGKSETKSAGVLATVFVLMKVLVSCFAAVIADGSLKQYKALPLYVQLNQMFFSWGLFSLVLALIFEPAVLVSPSAFFHGWNTATLLVVMSFSVKTVLTMTLLKVLDSIMKNIGEAVAVLVIYFCQILLPQFSKDFEVLTFLAMMCVIMTVTTYVFLQHDNGSKSQAPSPSTSGGQKAAAGP